MNCVDCHADLAHAELPHPEKLAKVDCASCHADEVALYKQSAHAAARAGGAEVAATCTSCHGTHDIRGSKDPQSRTYHFTIAATCAACHGNKDVIAKGHIAAGDVATPFADSIHGLGLSRSGLLVAPTCSDCHGPHDIRRKSDPASRVSLANTAATCGKCHEGICPAVRRQRPRLGADEGEQRRAVVPDLPHRARDRPGRQPAVAAQRREPVRHVPRGQAQDLPRHVPRQGHLARLPRRRDLRRLPRQPPDPAGERPGVADRPREPGPDLRQVPRRTPAPAS